MKRSLVRKVTDERPSRRQRMPKSRVYRSVAYTGETRLTRTCSGVVSTIEGGGFNIGASGFQAIAFVFNPTGVTIFGSAAVFTVVNLVNAAEIAALWDRVRIDKVEISWDPLCDKSTSGLSTSTPRFLVCNDVNNAATGTTLDDIKQHTDCTVKYGNGPHKWTVKPKFQRLLYYTALSSSYEPASGFVNTDTAIPHYSTHLGIENPGAVSATSVQFNFKFFLTLKNVK